VNFCAFFVLHPLAILVAMVINCLPSSLPTIIYPRYHLFARRVVGSWNRLPAHVDFSFLVRFKAFLNHTDFL